jgi:xanthine dehydrogenase iron-sulfur cluster and FAD-binding subunit A
MAVGHEALVEGDLRGGQGPDAHLVDLAADDEALEGFLDEEDGQLLLLAGLGEDGEEVGHRRRGDPGLLAVDDIAAVDLLRRGGDGVEVGAGVRLGHADGADLLAASGPA